MFGVQRKIMNIAAGLELVQEIYSLYESLKADGTLKEILEAYAALQVAYEKNPKIKELLQKLHDFKLEGK